MCIEPGGVGKIRGSSERRRTLLFKGHPPRIGAANTTVRIESSQRLILSNDVRSEAGFSELVKFILGDTFVPYRWEYADRAGTL